MKAFLFHIGTAIFCMFIGMAFYFGVHRVAESVEMTPYADAFCFGFLYSVGILGILNQKKDNK